VSRRAGSWELGVKTHHGDTEYTEREEEGRVAIRKVGSEERKKENGCVLSIHPPPAFLLSLAEKQRNFDTGPSAIFRDLRASVVNPHSAFS
jgi:hypothetical protein